MSSLLLHVVGNSWSNGKRASLRFLFIHSLLFSFIHSGYFYSASASPVLLRGTPDTARILCRSFTSKRHRQLRVRDLPKVYTWWLKRDLNPRPFGRKAANLPMSHHAPQFIHLFVTSEDEDHILDRRLADHALVMPVTCLYYVTIILNFFC